MSALPRTWKTNRCVAWVSNPAFRAAPIHFPDTGDWHIEDVIEDVLNARIAIVFRNPNAEWTLAEFAPLPVIGCFGLDGDTSTGVVSAQAAELHAAMLKLFTRETEGEPSRP